MVNTEIIKIDEIRNKIYTIRSMQVMLDEDLAELYGVETKVLNQAVKRNLDRFPGEFMFQITDDEFKLLKIQNVHSKTDSLRSQNVTLNADPLRSQFATLDNSRGKHRKYLPYAFTEQGVAMLSGVLKSETAVKMSIQIINAFVTMRRFMLQNAQIFQRLDSLENKQIVTDQKLDRVLNAIESKTIQPQQGIFFDGQVFDAYQFVSNLIRSAKISIVLIDNYIDDTVLTLFSKRKKGVMLTILTKTVSKQLELDIKKYNEQYPSVEAKEFKISHDRFLILDNTTVYHFGASLKDLGKKWFAFSKMDMGSMEILGKIKVTG